MKSTQAMRNRIRELMNGEQDDYDRAVECVLDDLEGILGVAQPSPDTIAVDTKLLHSLWCYGTLSPVEGVVYSYGSHQRCLDAVDDLIADHAHAVSSTEGRSHD